MRPSGNTVLTTGGSIGIGLALARSLAALDNEVIICGRRRDRLAAARSEVPSLHTKVCDASKPRSRAALVEWVAERSRWLNVLVNNAGVQHCVDLTRGVRDLSDASEEIATKAAFHSLSLSMRHQLRASSVRVFEVAPGSVDGLRRKRDAAFGDMNG